MTIHHAAYIIELDEFHLSLASKIVSDDGVDTDILRTLAIEVVRTASIDTLKTLEQFRFGAEWLSSADSESHLLYMIVLASKLQMTSGLSSNRFRGSWYVLEKSLSFLGWDDETANRLIYGKPVRTYLAEFKGGVFQQAFRGAFGGFLYLHHAEEMKERLSQISEYFERPSDTLTKEINEFAQHNSISPKDALSFAYRDAQDMLEAAIRDAKDLFLYLD